MELTESFARIVPRDVLARYEWREVRNAAAVLEATNPDRWRDVIEVLESFSLEARDLLLPGGNEGTVPKKLNSAFRRLGWREARVDSLLETTLVVFPWSGAGEKKVERFTSTPTEYEGYKADWFLDRVAGDVEYNAKDGNLDRDFASYRSLYETGFIDGAVLITRTQDDLRALEQSLVDEFSTADSASAAAALGTTSGMISTIARRLEGTSALRLDTTTSTNLPKAEHRLRRGDGGGCPILVVAISEATWDGSRVA